MNQSTNPRTIASGLIRQFLRGEAPTLTLADENLHLEDLARAHARNTAAITIHHARRLEADPNYRVPSNVYPLAREYLKSRGRR